MTEIQPSLDKQSFEGMSPLIIAGPSMVGKSALAATFAAAAAIKTNALLALGFGVEIITTDSFYMYASEESGIMLGVGLTRNDLKERKQALFGSLRPTDKEPTPEEYLQMAIAEVERVHALGRMAIFEGCSFSNTAVLLDHYGVNRLFFFPLSYSMLIDVVPKIEEAYDELVNLGLYDETQKALQAGYEDTYPLSSLIYYPVIQALKGKITPEEARQWVIEDWLDSIFWTDARFVEFFWGKRDKRKRSRCYIQIPYYRQTATTQTQAR